MLILLCYLSKWVHITFEKLGSPKTPSFDEFNATFISQISFVLPFYKLHIVVGLDALLGAALLSFHLAEDRSKHCGAELL